ncbi:hypothetical protein PAMP_009897 [Pampus punctatissimus]
MPTMVSRLPKFGSRPKSATSQMCPSATSNTGTFVSAAATNTRLTNGFYHHPGPVAAPPTSVKHNGFIRVPTSFSMNLRKENGMEDAEKEWRRGKDVCHYYPPREHGWPQRSPAVLQRDLKKPTTFSAGKGRGFGQPVTSKSSLPQSSLRSPTVYKSGFLGFKPNQAASGGTKQTQNGLSGPRLWNGAHDFMRQPQRFARSGPQSGSLLQKKPPASRSHSSDNIDSAPPAHLTESNLVRSHSLTQVQQQLSHTLPSPSPNVTKRGLKETPPRGSVVKSPVRSQTPEGGGGGVKAQKSEVGTTSLLPHPVSQKPLLPIIGPASKPSGISYKLSRPSLMKQSRPLRATLASVMVGDPEVDHGRRNNSPETTPEVPETEGLSTEVVSQRELSIVGETLEDMSLSSTSSLDRNDTSQEYMDDFDNLGNGGLSVLLLSSKNDEDDSGLDQSCTRLDDDKVALNGVTKETDLCFLDDSMDWAGVRLSGEQAEHPLTQRRSSQPDYHDQGGSSLDLSPSDSCGSGGTYMWDEEGLEPLGGADTTASIHTNTDTTHHIGSFDSDLNSIDVLNNLDSCDLEDDDLMLDADDASLHSDGDGMTHMAQWRRRQLCWGTQDVHNDNESDFQCYKLSEDPGNKRMDSTRDGDLILDLCPTRSACLSPSTPGLGLDVEELAEDCSAVKSQLEYLKQLLLQEDVDDETLSPEAVDSSHNSDTQVQSLLQEVQQLREELRSRDRTITQLTLQLTVPTATSRCRCQETAGRINQHTQTSVTERESVASQTPWREHTSQILHSSSQEEQESLTDQVQAPPPTQAPPPANFCSTHPETRPTGSIPGTISLTTEGGEEGGKREKKERRRTYIRSLQLPQPSKLRLFLSQPCGSAAASSPKSRAARQQATPLNPESGSNPGVKIKMPSGSGLSRLPKPKSH